jgi:hypothetical protein
VYRASRRYNAVHTQEAPVTPQPEQFVFPFELRAGDVILDDAGRGEVVAPPTRRKERQDYDLELTRYDGRGWRATFFVAGMEHSLTDATGPAWEPG